ncbi:hypothetical protein [Flintibacter sp. KGMB00164]|uniref:hypothetical protein n=1 Tax=Flintibacter sp. KGMB00164 TaxID=2610895 RepID=UPI001A9BBD55|nr:hypothetical protein [Flintibacter sp. KGMB00164]
MNRTIVRKGLSGIYSKFSGFDIHCGNVATQVISCFLSAKDSQSRLFAYNKVFDIRAADNHSILMERNGPVGLCGTVLVAAVNKNTIPGISTARGANALRCNNYPMAASSGGESAVINIANPKMAATNAGRIVSLSIDNTTIDRYITTAYIFAATNTRGIGSALCANIASIDCNAATAGSTCRISAANTGTAHSSTRPTLGINITTFNGNIATMGILIAATNSGCCTTSISIEGTISPDGQLCIFRHIHTCIIGTA